MLRQASVSDLITDKVSKDQSYIVITMRRYPRFVRRELRDEYLACTAAHVKLFEKFLTLKRSTQNHNGAFERSGFQKRFMPDPEGIEHIQRLSQMSQKKDVVLVCQCKVGYRCHRELIMLLAKEWFGAKVDQVTNDYPVFLERLKTEVHEKNPS